MHSILMQILWCAAARAAGSSIKKPTQCEITLLEFRFPSRWEIKFREDSKVRVRGVTSTFDGFQVNPDDDATLVRPFRFAQCALKKLL